MAGADVAAKTRLRAAARRALLLLALIALVAWPGAPSAQPAGSDSRLEVSAGAGWTDTGIKVAIGDSLSIEATGATFGPRPLTPDGFPGQEDVGLPAPELPPYALIGRIGGGAPFLVGAAYKGKAAEEGPLELRWNAEASRFSEGNQFYQAHFAFAVAIRHDPAPPVEEVTDPVDEDPDGPVEANLAEAQSNLAAEGNTAIANASAGPSESAGAAPRRDPGDDAPSADPPPGRGRISAAAAVGFGVAALLVLAAAAVGVQRLRRRRLVRSTRALLSVKPSLDRARELDRGGGFDVAGPAVRLRARLERGEGDGDG